MPVYQPNIPTGIVNLDQDYINIQGNFEQANVVFNVDHVPFDDVTNQKGYHKSIHFNPISTTTTNAPNNVPPVVPAAVPGYGQFFSVEMNDGYDTDNVLFWLTGDGKLNQLTANQRPVVNGFAGHTYLPGPGAFATGQGSSGTVQIQWGFVDGAGGLLVPGQTGIVNFVPAFANKLISVWTQLEYNNTTGTPGVRNAGTISVNQNSAFFTKTSFQWYAALDDSHYSGFLWIAIGT